MSKKFDYKKVKGLERKKARVGLLFTLPCLVMLFLIYGLPTLSSLYLTFNDWSFTTLPEFKGFYNYSVVLGDSKFWLSIKNTMYYLLLVVPLTIIISISIAILLDETSGFKLNTFFKTLYFIPTLISLVAVGFIWKWMFHPIYGLINQILGYVSIPPQKWLNSINQVIPSLAIMGIWSRIGFDMIIFLAGLQSIPSMYYEVAEIDGASNFAKFRFITLPLLNPQIVLVVIFELAFNLKVFDQVYTVTQGGPANASLTVVMDIYKTAFMFYRLGEACVKALILFLIIFVLSLVQFKIIGRKIEY